jgi:cyclic pyranopterin phosphate synthase
MSKLTHLDKHGAARMVDVSGKAVSERAASAEATIMLSAEAFGAVTAGTAKKGDVLAAARIAGILAAKKTSELIPLCHPIALTNATIDFEPEEARTAIRVIACAKTTGQTGVEMEALTAVSIAALTIYDMTKSLGKGATIENVRLLSKSGGKSGDYVAELSKNTEKPVYRSAGMRSHTRPSTLMGEVAAHIPRAEPNAAREAFRAFMSSRHLRATQWAKEADVPASQVYAYLTGKVRALSSDVAERLARAANSRVEDLFR